MYSVVLMTALAAGSATPDCHGLGGGCSTSCYGGGCYGGCYGGGCYGGGCYGGGCYGGGCYGGCYGGGCYGGCYGGGCYGGCHGGGGGSHHGSGGCWGSCYGCNGCWGSGYGYTAPGMAAPVYGASTYVTPGYSYTSPVITSYPTVSAPVAYGNDRQSAAKLTINLPAEAKLFVDGQLTTSASEKRVFTTPALNSGVTYYYDLKAEISRDGITHTESKRVIVHSGDSVQTSFAELEGKLRGSVIATTAGK